MTRISTILQEEEYVSGNLWPEWKSSYSSHLCCRGLTWFYLQEKSYRPRRERSAPVTCRLSSTCRLSFVNDNLDETCYLVIILPYKGKLKFNYIHWSFCDRLLHLYEFLPTANEVCGKVLFSHVFVCSDGGLCPRGSLSRGVSVRKIVPGMVKSGKYVSYWNAFLSKPIFSFQNLFEN